MNIFLSVAINLFHTEIDVNKCDKCTNCDYAFMNSWYISIDHVRQYKVVVNCSIPDSSLSNSDSFQAR